MIQTAQRILFLYLFEAQRDNTTQPNKYKYIFVLYKYFWTVDYEIRIIQM